MQWDESENAGFSPGSPWMKVNKNYKEISVARQIEDEDSILNFYKDMIRIRKESPELLYASYQLLMEEDKQIYAYRRIGEQKQYLVVCNISEEIAVFEQEEEINGKLMLSTYKDALIEGNKIQLHPYEARMYELI